MSYDYTQDANCQGAWTLDEASGNYVDSSIHGNTGAVTGGSHAAAKFGNGFFVTGAWNKIDCGSDASLDNNNTFTLCMWLKSTPTGGNSNCPVWNKGAGKYIYLLSFNNQLQVVVTASTTNASTTTTYDSPKISTTGFDHIAITYNDFGDRKIRIYKNGIEMSYSAQTAAVGTITDDSSDDFVIGTNGVDGVGTSYDDVGYFSRILSGTAITDIYNNGLKQSVVGVTGSPQLMTLGVG